MKLGTKIIMGFALANLVFIVLVVVVYVFMRPVQFGANDLTENVLPLMRDSADIQYDISQENFMMRTYLMNNSEEAWEGALRLSEAMRKSFRAFDENLASPNAQTIQIPEITEPYKALVADYNAYRTLADRVKSRQEGLRNSRSIIYQGRAEFEELVKN